MVVLDTEPMSLLEWSGAQGSAKLQARLATLQPVEVVTTIISYEEQVRGWMAYIARLRSVTQQVDAYRRLHRQLDNDCRIPVLVSDAPAAVTFQRLCRTRLRMGTMDLKIAAIVLSREATLRSRNLADLGRVPGLQVEDWTT
jgi:tRNA(fMet)-specific endonuclease VapC